jgi:hypothetical protein
MKVTTEASSTAKLRVSHCRGRPRGEYSEKLDREPGRVKPQPGQKEEKSIACLPLGAFFFAMSENSRYIQTGQQPSLCFTCLAVVRACY